MINHLIARRKTDFSNKNRNNIIRSLIIYFLGKYPEAFNGYNVVRWWINEAGGSENV